MSQDQLRALAFYLPQFHPVPENDAWWGVGFTEWRNVTRAKPLFEGHRQPRLPADLGFYDLRVPEIRHQQAKLARDAGLAGFCYYFYWFNGKEILERPLQDTLADPDYDFPICLFWANEAWTRTWSGKGSEVLMPQAYSAEDARALGDRLEPIFRDKRYVLVDGRPVFVIYHPRDLDILDVYVAEIRAAARRAGHEDAYVCMVLKHARQADHRVFGCDAMIEFPPSMSHDMAMNRRRAAKQFGPAMTPDFTGDLRHYGHLARNFIQAHEGQTVHRTVMVDFDNTARRGAAATVFPDASPQAYERWLRQAASVTRAEHKGDAQLMFIFAWNEWAEGAYLEPDQHYGHALLDATRKVLLPDAG